MNLRFVDGTVVTMQQERRPRTIRLKKKKRKSIAEFGISRLRPMQKKALQNYLDQGLKNQTKAATDAGYSLSNAHKVIPRLLQRKPIIEELEKKGVTDSRIATVIAEGLKARHPFKPDQPDHNARAKFVSEANRVRDNYPAKRVEVEDRTVVLHLTKDDYQAIKDFERLKNGNTD